MKSDKRLFERDLSWLAFNDRVLQEARDPTVPLYERIKFLAIWSSNLDEFFRVRVASLRSLLRLRSKGREELGTDPERLLAAIHSAVNEQQVVFGQMFRHQIVPELDDNGVLLAAESDLDPDQSAWVREYFEREVRSHVETVVVDDDARIPFLANRQIYLVTKLSRRTYGVVRVPTDRLPRFVTLPSREGRTTVMFLDDVVRLCLPSLFPSNDAGIAFAIKLTRDAELYIDDEFEGNLREKILKAIQKRKNGVPSRFLFDTQMPERMVRFLRNALGLAKEDLVLGGRYHNLHDLFGFPNPGIDEAEYTPLRPIVHPRLASGSPMFNVIADRDLMLHFPYHSFDGVIRFLDEASADQSVVSIQMTLYRVASDSRIIAALVDAAQRGKSVTVFVELKARFDEESNLSSAEELQRAGARVLYSMPGLKVHSKLCLVERTEGDQLTRYAYLGTGNFNEKTSRLYTDHGLFTADVRLTDDVAGVFHVLSGGANAHEYQHLLVAPFNMRSRFVDLINNEIDNAHRGLEASITLKMNSLEDSAMIKRLYAASASGVKVRLIVRGICCIVPGVRDLSENIAVTSIVDRFLEHARIYVFHNAGAELMFVASADWMTRNLSRRIEVGFPIYDRDVYRELREILDLQLSDSIKSRVITHDQTNPYLRVRDKSGLRSQDAIYQLLLERSVPTETAVAMPATEMIVREVHV
ncbi:MAG: polyphosphate kinase 1 [bacterium]|nr:polyphosphate kinase 1 [Candidatus Kapabacteria bacterium]